MKKIGQFLSEAFQTKQGLTSDDKEWIESAVNEKLNGISERRSASS